MLWISEYKYTERNTPKIFFNTRLWFTWYYTHAELHPREIVTTFLKLNSWSPGLGFIPIISTKRINQIDQKHWKIARKKLSFMHTKRFNTFFKRWVQFRVGAIPRLPKIVIKNILTQL